MDLVKNKVAQEVLLNSKLKEGVEEKLQRLTAEIEEDNTFKEALRQQLFPHLCNCMGIPTGPSIR
jgi:hypothetical protein